MPPLTYTKKYNNEEDNPYESPSDPTSVYPTPEPGPPNEKPTKEPTSETDLNKPSEPSAPTREGYMGQLPPRDIILYQKVSYPPIFVNLEEQTKEDPWVDIWKIQILGQDESLEAGEDLLTSDWDIIPNTHQLGEVGQIFLRR